MKHSAKDIFVKPISRLAANRKCKEIHYSGKVAHCSRLHFGVFLNGKLEGVIQFGEPIDRRRMITLVGGTKWSEMTEINRMAFSDKLPRFSESRALGVCLRLIKKHYPQIKWIVSFADSTRCGDGTIYRASGFDLIGIKKNTSMLMTPTGEVVANKTFGNNPAGKYKGMVKKDCHKLEGYQLKYIYFIDKSYKEKLTVPVLPFSKIDEMGAGMYKGERVSMKDRRVKLGDDCDQQHSGGATPTDTLQIQGVA